MRRGGSGSSDLDLMEQEELHDLVVSLRHDLDNSQSEVALLRKSASMSSKDFVQVCHSGHSDGLIVCC